MNIDQLEWTTIKEDPIFGKTEEAVMEDGRRIQRVNSGTLWIESEPGKFRCCASIDRPRKRVNSSIHDLNEFQDGSFRYVTHEYRDRAEAIPCIEDLGDANAMKSWPRYHVDSKTGRHGPMPFRTRQEKRDYYKTFGFEDR